MLVPASDDKSGKAAARKAAKPETKKERNARLLPFQDVVAATAAALEAANEAGDADTVVEAQEAHDSAVTALEEAAS